MSPPHKFMLPDLVSHCSYPLRINPHCEPIARESERWLLDGAHFSGKQRRAFMGLRAGELTAQCYPDVDAFHLRVSSDFMNFLFTLDDWSDEFDAEDTCNLGECVLGALRDPSGYRTDKAAGKMAKDFFSRFRKTGGPGCTQRFTDTMDLFFKAIKQQALDRAEGDVPDLEAYIAMRRDTSGCKPCFALIEFAAGVDLPDEVMQHPIIQALEEATNDLITWSNDIFSYNVEQARGDTHNMIVVVMQQQGLSLQGAVDFVGDLCKASINRFESDRYTLPSWGPVVDRNVAIYIQGLQDWMVGSLHWSFQSERYFGNQGTEVKKHRTIELLPLVDI